ncbi:MAG: HD domain-containing protein [Proteobacteria bacterium]|nr:HD domain-containing protein [Pseudomonadota bacterium]
MAEELDIYDDLHGVVHLEPHERRLLDSPWFQRLRRIRQLGVAHMVFPGAEHTRFAHSIGVLHLASKVGKKLHLDKQELNELRAAALLHDIGHFPFSHTLESVYSGLAESDVTRKTRKYTRPKRGAQAHDSGREQSDVHDDRPKFHEEFGQRVINETSGEEGISRILRDAKPRLEPERVGAIVVGEHENVLLNQVVHSDLDVDQLDYLLRDAKATGSSYGQYDLDYLIECMEVVKVGGSPMLCTRAQGLHPLEHYVLAKYFYYMCILYHKTRCAAEGILQEVACQLIEEKRLPSWKDVENGLENGALRVFDDTYVWDVISRAARDSELDPELREAARMLTTRQFPKVHSERHKTVEGKGPDCEHGARPGDGWNAVVENAMKRQGHQDFPVLEQALRGKKPTKEEFVQLLQEQSRPKGTPTAAAVDKKGKPAGRVVLLESLSDSVVGRLAGLTTHIFRVYKPS